VPARISEAILGVGFVAADGAGTVAEALQAYRTM